MLGLLIGGTIAPMPVTAATARKFTVLVYRVEPAKRAMLVDARSGAKVPMPRAKPERVASFDVTEWTIDGARFAVREHLTARGFLVRTVSFTGQNNRIVAYVEEKTR